MEYYDLNRFLPAVDKDQIIIFDRLAVKSAYSGSSAYAQSSPYRGLKNGFALQAHGRLIAGQKEYKISKAFVLWCIYLLDGILITNLCQSVDFAKFHQTKGCDRRL